MALKNLKPKHHPNNGKQISESKRKEQKCNDFDQSKQMSPKHENQKLEIRKEIKRKIGDTN